MFLLVIVQKIAEDLTMNVITTCKFHESSKRYLVCNLKSTKSFDSKSCVLRQVALELQHVTNLIYGMGLFAGIIQVQDTKQRKAHKYEVLWVI